MRCPKWIELLLPLTIAGGGMYAQMPAKKAPISPDQGFELQSSIDVNDNVSVEATLLPPTVTRGVFGKAVADRYAAVQLIISNRSGDAALIVHSVFLDYSRWLLSSASLRELPECPAKGESKTLPQCVNPPMSWQAQTKPSQIAASEYRVPRAQLLHAQQWSTRNLTVRALELAGTIAAGYIFSLSEPGYAKGVAAFNGNVLPGVRALLPDSTIAQLNSMDDLGYRVNKIVPKQSSEAIVAFFPIDRFLTPGFKKLFAKSPALFFVPLEGMLDPKMQKLLTDAVPELAVPEFRRDLIKAMRTGEANDVTKMLDRLSLNRVRVIVGGAMTVDAASIPAIIEDIQFEEEDPALLWLEPGDKKGTIRGRFLSGGKVVIEDAAKLGLDSIPTISDGNTEESLHFTIHLNKSLEGPRQLTFRVDKTNKDKVVKGVPRLYAKPEALPTQPSIVKVEREGNMVTITGKRFFDTESTPLSVRLVPGFVTGVDAVSVPEPQKTATELKLDLTKLARPLPAACWSAEVNVGTMTARAATAFAEPPKPVISEAAKSGNRIVVKGQGFVNLAVCGAELQFEVASAADGKYAKAANLRIDSTGQASFDLPSAGAGAGFTVRVLTGGVEAATQAVK